MNELRRILPSRIEGTFDLPKIREMTQVSSEAHVRMFIEMELARLGELVSVGGNLTAVQIEHIAENFVNEYPNETIADIKICFSRGASGRYGDIFRMDGIVINKWFKQYLDEKYQALEDKLMKEKEASMYSVPEPPLADQPNATDWYQKWLDAVGSAETNVKKVRPLTDDEIIEEGQVKPPKRKIYVYDQTEAGIYATERLAFLRECQERTVRDRHPEWTDEQILNRVDELQKEEVTKSGTHSILKAAKKIRPRY